MGLSKPPVKKQEQQCDDQVQWRVSLSSGLGQDNRHPRAHHSRENGQERVGGKAGAYHASSNKTRMTFSDIPRFCLTLPEKPHRREAAAKHFAESGVGPVTFVAGINGEAFGVKTIYPYTLDDARDRPPEQAGTFFAGHHETGIFLSHYMLWNAQLLLGHAFMVVFEDDVQLLPNWKERVNKALNECPSFDWMFCGSCGGAGRQKKHIIGEVFDVQYPSCFHFYIVSKRGAAILAETQRKIWGPVDITTFMEDPRGGSRTAFHRMRVVTILPRVAGQFNTMLPD